MKTLFTMVCTADRRKDKCMADAGAKKGLIHYSDWLGVCMRCEFGSVKLTTRGEELDKRWFGDTGTKRSTQLDSPFTTL